MDQGDQTRFTLEFTNLQSGLNEEDPYVTVLRACPSGRLLTPCLQNKLSLDWNSTVESQRGSFRIYEQIFRLDKFCQQGH